MTRPISTPAANQESQESLIVLENQNLLAAPVADFKITSQNQTCIEGCELGKITVFRLNEQYFPSAKQSLTILVEKKLIAADYVLDQPVIKGLTAQNTFDVWDCADKTEPLFRIRGRVMILMVSSNMFIILHSQSRIQKQAFPFMQN